MSAVCAITASGSRSRAVSAALGRSPGPRGRRVLLGTRAVSAPVDVGVGARTREPATRSAGGYAQLAGDASCCATASARTARPPHRRSPSRPTAPPASPAAPSRSARRPRRARRRSATRRCPGSATRSSRPRTSPNRDGRVLAISRQGAAILYTPDRGWIYPDTPLTPTQANDRVVPLRAIAWPRTNVVIGVGSAGALVTVLRDPAPFDLTTGFSDNPRTLVEAYNDLPIEATLLDVACSASDPLECTAVGRKGLIVRGDGRKWHIEHLPRALRPPPTSPASPTTGGRRWWRPPTASTGVMATAAGRATRICARRWRARGGRPRWSASRPSRRRHGRRRALRARRRDGAMARDERASGPVPVAIAAVRDGGQVRTIVSAAPAAPPLPEPVEPPCLTAIRPGRRTDRGSTPCRSTRPRSTRWCCARPPTAGSTSTARTTRPPGVATSRGRRPTRARSSSTRTAPASRSAESPACRPTRARTIRSRPRRARAGSTTAVPPRRPRPPSSRARPGRRRPAWCASRSAGIRRAWTVARAAPVRA